MPEPIIVISLIFLIVLFSCLYIWGVILADRIDLEITKTHLKGKLEVRDDGVYIGEVKIEGVSELAIRPLSDKVKEVELKIIVLDNGWRDR